MRAKVIETSTNRVWDSEISLASRSELPFKKEGWKFNWRKLKKVEGSMLYKLTIENERTEVQGMLMLTLYYEAMLFMNNLEVAPGNLGKAKKYDRVAGCLIAFACRMSFELGKEDYLGYLSFDSKTSLVELYQNKYGARFAMGNKMFFDPEAGKKLMKEYLGI